MSVLKFWKQLWRRAAAPKRDVRELPVVTHVLGGVETDDDPYDLGFALGGYDWGGVARALEEIHVLVRMRPKARGIVQIRSKASGEIVAVVLLGKPTRAEIARVANERRRAKAKQ